MVAAAIPSATVKASALKRTAPGRSLSTMLIVATLSGPSCAPPAGLFSRSATDSAASNTVSLMIGTVKVRLAMPGPKVRVPLTVV